MFLFLLPETESEVQLDESPASSGSPMSEFGVLFPVKKQTKKNGKWDWIYKFGK